MDPPIYDAEYIFLDCFCLNFVAVTFIIHILLMQASKFDDHEYTFMKTCAFDSCFHAVLVSAYDRPEVRKAVLDRRRENSLFDLVADTMEKGLRAQSYRLRGDILLKIHQSTNSYGNSMLIDCETNACYVISKLFIETPSVREISPCSEGCEYVPKQLRTLCLSREELLDPCVFENILVHLRSKRRQGTCAKCRAPTTHQYTAIGLFSF